MPVIQRLATGGARGFGFGKSGAVYQQIITETATASDVIGRSVLNDIEIAETASASDLITTLPIYIDAIAETASASDAISGDRTLISNTEETATGTDISSALGTFNHTLIETAIAADSISAPNQQLVSTVSEFAIGVDAQTSTLILPSSISEIGIASDATEGSRTYLSSVDETGIAFDAITVGVLSTSNIVEISTGSDLIDVSGGAPAIGAFIYGGYYAGMIDYSGTGAGPFYYLIVVPKSAQAFSLDYKTTDTATGGANSMVDGAANTSYLVGVSPTIYPAAGYCDGLTTNGYTDWYLPAYYELEICYYNLKPSTTANNTGSGTTNPYAVPPRSSPYTTSSPAQTSAVLFQSGGSEAFPTNQHWTSTNQSTAYAWTKNFGAGSVLAVNKSYGNYVRAIRRVAVA